MAKGLESVPEGGERCFACYRLRLLETAKKAAEGGYDYFTTTLSISPLKNADKLNSIGEEISDAYGVPYLYSDFKKKKYISPKHPFANAIFIRLSSTISILFIAPPPYAPEVLKMRVARTLEMDDYHRKLSLLVQQKSKRIEKMQTSIIANIANLIENRDKDSGQHVKRVGFYMGIIADRLRKMPDYQDLLNERLIRNMMQASALHDVGKISISDNILCKAQTVCRLPPL